MNKISNIEPQVTILSDDDNGTVIKIDISGFNFQFKLIQNMIAYGRISNAFEFWND